MSSPATKVDELARVLLARLESAGRADESDPAEQAMVAIGILPRLHARTVDGGLPGLVDGRDFLTDVARLFNQVRRPAGVGAVLLISRVEGAREPYLDIALEQRSAVQFLIDDFRGTVAEGLVDDDLFDDGVDSDLAEKLREDGPLDIAVPPHLPASHWWWALARGEEPAEGVIPPG